MTARTQVTCLLATAALLLSDAPASHARAQSGPTPPAGVVIPPYGFGNDPLPMIIRGAIPNALGRIDKVAFDEDRYVVFVAGTRANMVYAQSLVSHRSVATLSDLPEPRGVVFLRDAQRLVVSCGGDGSVRIFDVKSEGDADPQSRSTQPFSIEPAHHVKFYGEADGLVIDPTSDSETRAGVWVSFAMSVQYLDAVNAKKGPEIKLPGRADGVIVHAHNNQTRVYINVPRPEKIKDKPDSEQPGPMIVVADATSGDILERWPIADAKANTALALDADHNRLFVLTREPAKVVVFDLATGTETARFDAPSDADDLWYDPSTQRLFVVGGGDGGKIGIFERQGVGAVLDKTPKASHPNLDRYERVHTASTAAGCRTAAYSFSQRLLIAAAPPLGSDPLFLYVYRIGP